jgi:hypothetical protein
MLAVLNNLIIYYDCNVKIILPIHNTNKCVVGPDLYIPNIDHTFSPFYCKIQ